MLLAVQVRLEEKTPTSKALGGCMTELDSSLRIVTSLSVVLSQVDPSIFV